MVKLIVGLLVATAITATSGVVLASNQPNQANLTGYTKDQCKNGGWQQLGFKNQGACVSYFASGGKSAH